MERFSARTIDELGQMGLHGELRQKLGIGEGDSITLKPVDTLIILQKAVEGEEQDGFTCPVNALGMFELPRELRQQFGWKAKDKIAVYNTDNVLILKLAA